ncbi:hypothetical protein ACJ41O_014096 [Fusarium nematophilum]
MDNKPSTGLTSLPVEIVLYLIKDESLSRNDLKNLAMTSSGLFYLTRPLVYPRDEFETFHKAVTVADIECMNRCVQFDAAPVNMRWKVGDSECIGLAWCTSLSHDYNRPIDCLIESFGLDRITLDQLLEGARWLIERDADIRDACICHFWPEDAIRCPDLICPREFHLGRSSTRCMPSSLLHILNEEMFTTKKYAAEASRLIRCMSNKGYELPMMLQEGHLFARSYDPYNRPPHRPHDPRCRDRNIPGVRPFRPFKARPGFDMVSVMLRSACAPFVLGIFLEQFEARGVKRTWEVGQCPTYHDWAMHSGTAKETHGTVTEVGEIVRSLWNDLFDPHPQAWKEEYPGEMAEIFGEKVDLLVRYDAVDQGERRALEKILATLVKLQERAVEEHSLDVDKCYDEQEWGREFSALMGTFLPDGDFEPQEAMAGRPERLHRIVYARKHHEMWDDYFKNKEMRG